MLQTMTFKPGQSGNPRGRPRGTEREKVITQMLTSALNEAHASGDKSKMRAVIDAWIEAAIGGELSAIIAIADRLEGKPIMSIDHSGELDVVPRTISAEPLTEQQWIERFGASQH